MITILADSDISERVKDYQISMNPLILQIA